MKKIKMEKGITLIALIITIIVLLILAVVTINSIEDSEIITYSQKSKNDYNQARIKEEIDLYSMEYYMRNKRSIQKSTTDKMIDVCTTLGILPEQLTVYYDLYNAKQNKTNQNSELQEEYVLYRIDKTTEQERDILEQNGIKALLGDVDLDGVLTENDVNILDKYIVWDIELTEIQLYVADMDKDGMITYSDSSSLNSYINGMDTYLKVYTY